MLQYYKLSVDQYESDLLAVVNSLMLSMSGTDLHLVKSGPCNASCIRFSLVKLLRLSGYDAVVCSSKWQGNGKVPGGRPSDASRQFVFILACLYNIEGKYLTIWRGEKTHLIGP